MLTGMMVWPSLTLSPLSFLKVRATGILARWGKCFWCRMVVRFAAIAEFVGRNPSFWIDAEFSCNHILFVVPPQTHATLSVYR